MLSSLLLMVVSLLFLSATFRTLSRCKHMHTRTPSLLLLDMLFQRGQECHPVYRLGRYIYPNCSMSARGLCSLNKITRPSVGPDLSASGASMITRLKR